LVILFIISIFKNCIIVYLKVIGLAYSIKNRTRASISPIYGYKPFIFSDYLIISW
jgi:hypothetical protein